MEVTSEIPKKDSGMRPQKERFEKPTLQCRLTHSTCRTSRRSDGVCVWLNLTAWKSTKHVKRKNWVWGLTSSTCYSNASDSPGSPSRETMKLEPSLCLARLSTCLSIASMLSNSRKCATVLSCLHSSLADEFRVWNCWISSPEVDREAAFSRILVANSKLPATALQSVAVWMASCSFWIPTRSAWGRSPKPWLVPGRGIWSDEANRQTSWKKKSTNLKPITPQTALGATQRKIRP